MKKAALQKCTRPNSPNDGACDLQPIGAVKKKEGRQVGAGGYFFATRNPKLFFEFEVLVSLFHLNIITPNQIQSVPVIWSSDIRSFRRYGQFFLGPERNSLSYNKKFRIYGLYFGYMV